MKRPRRNSRGDVLRAKKVEEHSKTTLGLLENADSAPLPEPINTSTVEQPIDEELRLSKAKDDDSTQVNFLIENSNL